MITTGGAVVTEAEEVVEEGMAGEEARATVATAGLGRETTGAKGIGIGTRTRDQTTGIEGVASTGGPHTGIRGTVTISLLAIPVKFLLIL